ncbi:IucA/IucC family protein, partial [Streptomyces sp. NPDC005122]
MPNPSASPASEGLSALYDPPELREDRWEQAGRRLLAKMIGEFAHEEIVRPEQGHPGPSAHRDAPHHDAPHADAPHADALRPYTLRLDAGDSLSFRARRLSYDSWRVDPASLTLTEEGKEPCPFTDPLGFLTRARGTLELDGATLGHALRELSTTLAADVRLDRDARTAAELADLGYAELEGHQTGHPWIVLNKGRLGFSARDAAAWAPEARRATPLPWIA